MILLCFSTANTLACEQAEIPFDLLGRKFEDVRSQFAGYIINADFEDEYWNSKVDERVIVIDKRRRFLSLQLVDGVVAELLVSDPLFTTQKGISIGNAFSQVRSAYPDAVFPDDYSLSINNGRVRFSFKDKIRADNETAQEMKLWLISTTSTDSANAGDAGIMKRSNPVQSRFDDELPEGVVTRTDSANGRLYERGDGASVLVRNDTQIFGAGVKQILHALDVSASVGKQVQIVDGWESYVYGEISVRIDGLDSVEVAGALHNSGHFNRVSSYSNRDSAHADYHPYGDQGLFHDWDWKENTASFYPSLASTLACEQTQLPFDLLGKNFRGIRSRFLMYAYEADLTDGYGNDKSGYCMLAIDKGRGYLTLHLVDGVVAELYVSDPLFSTEEGVRVGSAFSQVRSAYPDAKFVKGEDAASSGNYDLSVNNGQIEFWFKDDEIRKMVKDGTKVSIDDEAVQKMKLWRIQAKHRQHIGQ